MNALSIKGWQFVFLVSILSIVPYIFILNTGNSDTPWTLLLMWIPTLSAISMRLYYKEGLFKGIVWNPIKDLKWILIAAFIPFAVEIISILITILLDAAIIQENFISIKDGNISIKGVGMLFGAQAQPWYFFIANYLLSFFVGALIYGFMFALGEEYGWRGYLQKEWVSDNNVKGYIAIGIIWGLWHFPAILQGHNYPDYPILGAFILMPLLCSIFSVAFGTVYNRRNVIWVATIFHSALNLSADVSNTVFIEETINKPINDIIWTTLWLIVAIIVYRICKTKKNV